MAPIPRLAAGPLSIITGALLSALSGPNSAPPSNGSNATIWGTEYRGTASFLNLTLVSTPASSPTSTSSSSLPSPTTPTSSTSNSSSLVFFNTKTDTYTACNNQTFSSSDSIVLINPLQFGNVTAQNSTCGQWIQIQNRENTLQSTYAQIVGVCDDCDYGSVALSVGALESLAPDVPFDQMWFNDNSNYTIANLTDPVTPMPVNTTVISPKNLLDIEWEMSDPPPKSSPLSATSSVAAAPVPTMTTTTTLAAPTTTNAPPAPSPTTKNPAPSPSPSPPAPKPSPSPGNGGGGGGGGGKQFTGRATWYSDTFGQCEQHYSQSDMIVAVNQAQMGTGTSICGKKILLTEKNSNTQVVVTVVDMCPSQYCSFGDLDLSQAAFKQFAGLGVGELQLQWSFM